MPVFSVPPIRTFGLKATMTPEVFTAARKAMDAEIDPDALELLVEVASWAYVALRARDNAKTKVLFDALRKLEVCELEVARRRAVQAPEFQSMASALDLEVRHALELTLITKRVDQMHRRLVVKGLKSLRHLEQETDAIVERDIRRAAKDPVPPRSNRSKGRRRPSAKRS